MATRAAHIQILHNQKSAQGSLSQRGEVWQSGEDKLENEAKVQWTDQSCLPDTFNECP